MKHEVPSRAHATDICRHIGLLLLFLYYFILFYFILFHFILFYFILFYFILFYRKTYVLSQEVTKFLKILIPPPHCSRHNDGTKQAN